VLNSFKRLYALLNASQRRRLAMIGLLTALAAPLEMAGLGLTLPLLQLALTPEKIAQLPVLSRFAGVPRDHLLLGFAVGLFLFYIVKNALLLLIVLRQKRYAKRVEAELRVALLESYLACDYAEHLRRNSAEMLRTIMRSASAVVSGMLMPALELGLESVIAVSALTVLFTVEPVATLTASVFLGAGFGTCYVLLRRRLTEWGYVSEGMTTRMYLWINQSLGAIRETLVLGRGRFFVDAFAHAAHTLARHQARADATQQFPRLVGEVIVLGAVLAVITIALWRSDSATDAMPLVGLFVVAAFRILPSLNRVTAAAAQFRQNAPALDNVAADFRPRPPQPAAPVRSMAFDKQLALAAVDYRYPATPIPALDGITLTLRKGETVALIGPSGAGKSTLADIVLGLLEPTAGTMLVDGIDVRTNLAGWQRHLGFVPQSIFLSDDTLRRNIAFGLPDSQIDEARVRAATAMAQLDDLLEALPKGLDTLVGERGARLSGGQRQRVGIARALYNDPDLLVLDEATSALDSETENRITALMNSFRGRKTLIVIAHRLSTVRHCDRLIFLAGGQVEGIGTFEELQRTNSAFRRMVQAGELNLEAVEAARA